MCLKKIGSLEYYIKCINDNICYFCDEAECVLCDSSYHSVNNIDLCKQLVDILFQHCSKDSVKAIDSCNIYLYTGDSRHIFLKYDEDVNDDSLVKDCNDIIYNFGVLILKLLSLCDVSNENFHDFILFKCPHNFKTILPLMLSERKDDRPDHYDIIKHVYFM